MTPAVSTPLRSTPLSGMRARLVRDTPQSTGAGRSENASEATADALALLDSLSREYEAASLSNEKDMGDLADNMTAVQTFRQSSVATLKETAGELLSAVAAAKDLAQPVTTREEHEEKVYAAEKEKYAVAQEIRQREEEVARLRSATETIARSASETAGKELHIREYLKQNIPVLEAKHKLYVSLSGTKIYRGNPDSGDDVVTGYVVDKEGNDVRPFTYDLSRTSCYEAVNALWDLI
jgi:hypothetical protein